MHTMLLHEWHCSKEEMLTLQAIQAEEELCLSAAMYSEHRLCQVIGSRLDQDSPLPVQQEKIARKYTHTVFTNTKSTYILKIHSLPV